MEYTEKRDHSYYPNVTEEIHFDLEFNNLVISFKDENEGCWVSRGVDAHKLWMFLNDYFTKPAKDENV